MLVVAVGFLVAWILPLSVVGLCRSRAGVDEGSLFKRIAEYSDEHPIRLILLEAVPAILFVVFQYPINDLVNLSLLPIFLVFLIFRIVAAWRTNKYEW